MLWTRNGRGHLEEYFRFRPRFTSGRNCNAVDFTMEHSNGRKHDVHAMPPQAICDLYRRYQKLDNASIDADVNIVDFRRGLTKHQQERIVPVETVSSEVIVQAEKAFRTANGDNRDTKDATRPPACTIYEHKDFPGIYSPSLSSRI